MVLTTFSFPRVNFNSSHVKKKSKNAQKGGLYLIWDARKLHWRTTGGFIKDIVSPLASLPQNFYQNAIEQCRKVIQICRDNRNNIRFYHFLFKGKVKSMRKKKSNRYSDYDQKFLTSMSCPNY